MARRSREDELIQILSPLSMAALDYMTRIGKGLDLDETVEFLQFMKRKGIELTAAAKEQAAREVRNGASL